MIDRAADREAGIENETEKGVSEGRNKDKRRAGMDEAR